LIVALPVGDANNLVVDIGSYLG